MVTEQLSRRAIGMATNAGYVCALHMEPIFLPVDIQHT